MRAAAALFATTVALLGGAIQPTAAGATTTAVDASSSPTSLPDVASPTIHDPISEAELQDLQAVAIQSGLTLRSAIDRYAWNDNFALAVAKIRESSPDDFTGAAILGAGDAWVAFAGDVPKAARDIISDFGGSHKGVAVELRSGLGFTEKELEAAIKDVHYAILEAPGVSDASTSYDFEKSRIVTLVTLDESGADAVFDSLQPLATKALSVAPRANVANHFAATVARSSGRATGGTDSSSYHYGGEILSSCTSGFGTANSSGVRGISTAGHCSNSQYDDGYYLTYRSEHRGSYGDFQWHTGTRTHSDDFYAGTSSTTEASLRDVSYVGSPVVGQSLCTNGKTSHKICQEVRKLNVCNGSACSLVEMGSRSAAGGDSGGPVYWENTAYGIHQGYISDPFWPYDRDVFSRADKMWAAIGVYVLAIG